MCISELRIKPINSRYRGKNGRFCKYNTLFFQSPFACDLDVVNFHSPLPTTITTKPFIQEWCSTSYWFTKVMNRNEWKIPRIQATASSTYLTSANLEMFISPHDWWRLLLILMCMWFCLWQCGQIHKPCDETDFWFAWSPKANIIALKWCFCFKNHTTTCWVFLLSFTKLLSIQGPEYMFKIQVTDNFVKCTHFFIIFKLSLPCTKQSFALSSIQDLHFFFSDASENLLWCKKMRR